MTHGTVGGTDSHRVSPLARVVSVEVTSDPLQGTESDTYGNRQLIQVTATFNNDITVTGDPGFQFKVGDDDKLAAYYISLSTTKSMVFQYRVQAADMDDNGIWIGTETDTFQLATDDSIKDSADRGAALNHGALGTLSGHKVDGSLTPPPSAPSFPDDNPPDGADPITMTVVENSPSRTAVGRADAEDQDGDFSIYSVGGADASAFDQVFTMDTVLSIIRVKTGATVDYESKASYSITLNVTDGEDASGNPETPSNNRRHRCRHHQRDRSRGRRRDHTVQSHAIRGNCNNRHSHRL